MTVDLALFNLEDRIEFRVDWDTHGNGKSPSLFLITKEADAGGCRARVFMTRKDMATLRDLLTDELKKTEPEAKEEKPCQALCLESQSQPLAPTEQAKMG